VVFGLGTIGDGIIPIENIPLDMGSASSLQIEGTSLSPIHTIACSSRSNKQPRPRRRGRAGRLDGVGEDGVGRSGGHAG
jgi:hypothetical protein